MLLAAFCNDKISNHSKYNRIQKKYTFNYQSDKPKMVSWNDFELCTPVSTVTNPITYVKMLMFYICNADSLAIMSFILNITSCIYLCYIYNFLIFERLQKNRIILFFSLKTSKTSFLRACHFTTIYTL